MTLNVAEELRGSLDVTLTATELAILRTAVVNLRQAIANTRDRNETLDALSVKLDPLRGAR